jgi:hypothetical protein
MYFDEHNYESAIKDLKEASAIDDRNLKVYFYQLVFFSNKNKLFYYRYK